MHELLLSVVQKLADQLVCCCVAAEHTAYMSWCIVLTGSSRYFWRADVLQVQQLKYLHSIGFDTAPSSVCAAWGVLGSVLLPLGLVSHSQHLAVVHQVGLAQGLPAAVLQGASWAQYI